MIPITNIIDLREPKITETSLERVKQLLLKGTITKQLSEDKSKLHLLSSNTVQNFLKTYPDYKMTVLSHIQDCIVTEWARHNLIQHKYGEEIIGIDIQVDRLMREIVPQFLRWVFLKHPEAFLNSTLDKQVKIIDNSVQILEILQNRFNIDNFELFFTQTLSRLDLQKTTNLLCSDEADSLLISLVGNHIETLIKSIHN